MHLGRDGKWAVLPYLFREESWKLSASFTIETLRFMKLCKNVSKYKTAKKKRKKGKKIKWPLKRFKTYCIVNYPVLCGHLLSTLLSLSTCMSAAPPRRLGFSSEPDSTLFASDASPVSARPERAGVWLGLLSACVQTSGLLIASQHASPLRTTQAVAITNGISTMLPWLPPRQQPTRPINGTRNRVKCSSRRNH